VAGLPWMSRPATQIGAEYDVVIVGSGYGGGIMAARLAAAHFKVCLLERGRELHPGDYPSTPRNGLPHVQARTPFGHIGASNALFDFRMHRDMSVLVGSGLGGTSLINAGVALRPRDEIFQDSRWPRALQVPHVLDPWYDMAESMLGSTQVPTGTQLAKFKALGRVGRQALGRDAELTKINVSFSDGPNAANIYQPACTGCGDCVSGCNVGAKNTVLMNYLPYAFSRGAHIFTEVDVRTVTRRNDRWVVRFRAANARGRDDAVTRFVRAPVVVLAAGSLGTTEILLRSRENGLEQLSDRLGERFTGNGDVLGFAYDTDRAVHSIGVPVPADGRKSPGPCIDGVIDMRDAQTDGGYIIEDGVVPSVLRMFMPLGFAMDAAALALGDKRARPSLSRLTREFAGALLGPFAGPTDRTLVFLVMSSDDDNGRIELVDDHAEVRWRGVGERPPIQIANDVLRRASAHLSGTYLPDPIWSTPFGHSVITVHPLGGCVMADAAEDGVVSQTGEVFSGTSGRATHPGLYIADGSIVPRPLAANPSLTISALAERMAAQVTQTWGSP